MRQWIALAVMSAAVLAGCSDEGTLLRGDIGNVPRLAHTALQLQFDAEVGDSAEATLTVRNTGRVTLIIDTVTADKGDFVVLDWTRSIPPGSSGTITVRYRASTAEAAAILTIRSNASPATEEIALIGSSASGGALVSYADAIRPIFLVSCAVTGCHNSTTRQSNLDLSDYASAKARVTAGNPQQSILYTYVNTGYMPFGRTKLSQDQIDLIRRWIEDGARE